MVTSGLNSFLGFSPNGKVHEGGDRCAPSRPGRGGGGGAPNAGGIPKAFKNGGGGGGGGGGGIAPLEGSGGGGSGNWCGPVASAGTTDASPRVDGRQPGGKEPYW